MTDNHFPADLFDELDNDIELDSLLINKRISVRYRRKDLKAVVKTHSLFFPQLIKVQLMDISSKGAAIHCTKKLRNRSKVTFYIQFNDGRRFTIKALVANTHAAPRYGLKFDFYQAELADHLLATQTELLFG